MLSLYGFQFAFSALIISILNGGMGLASIVYLIFYIFQKLLLNQSVFDDSTFDASELNFVIFTLVYGLAGWLFTSFGVKYWGPLSWRMNWMVILSSCLAVVAIWASLLLYGLYSVAVNIVVIWALFLLVWWIYILILWWIACSNPTEEYGTVISTPKDAIVFGVWSTLLISLGVMPWEFFQYWTSVLVDPEMYTQYIVMAPLFIGVGIIWLCVKPRAMNCKPVLVESHMEGVPHGGENGIDPNYDGEENEKEAKEEVIPMESESEEDLDSE